MPAFAAKAATTKIPIVFTIGGDPVQLGLVENLNRPGGNLTGVSSLVSSLGSKELGLLRELVPNAALIAVLANPNDTGSERQINDVQEAARALGQEIMVLSASNEREIDAAFTTIVAGRTGALLVTIGPFFLTRARLFALLAARHGSVAAGEEPGGVRQRGHR